MSVNKAILLGNVGKEPECRAAGSTKVATFSLATSEKYKDKEITTWHNIVAWAALADIAEKYIHKGTQLYIEGPIRTREYTDTQGVKKYITEITANSIQLLGKPAVAPAPAPAPLAEAEHDLPW